MVTLDEMDQRNRLFELPQAARAAFAAACAERLFGGYVQYARAAEIDGEEILAQSIATTWEAVHANDISNGHYSTAANRCEELVPDSFTDSNVGRPYAEDAVAAAVYALQSLDNDDVALATWAAQCVHNALDTYLTDVKGIDLEGPDGEDQVLSHPLMQAELARQEHDLASLESAASPDQFIQTVEALRLDAQANRIVFSLDDQEDAAP